MLTRDLWREKVSMREMGVFICCLPSSHGSFVLLFCRWTRTALAECQVVAHSAQMKGSMRDNNAVEVVEVVGAFESRCACAWCGTCSISKEGRSVREQSAKPQESRTNKECVGPCTLSRCIEAAVDIDYVGKRLCSRRSSDLRQCMTVHRRDASAMCRE